MVNIENRKPQIVRIIKDNMYNRRRKQEPNRTEQKLTSVTVIYGISLYAITYRVIAEALKNYDRHRHCKI